MWTLNLFVILVVVTLWLNPEYFGEWLARVRIAYDAYLEAHKTNASGDGDKIEDTAS